VYARYCSQVSDWLNGLAAWVARYVESLLDTASRGIAGVPWCWGLYNGLWSVCFVYAARHIACCAQGEVPKRPHALILACLLVVRRSWVLSLRLCVQFEEVCRGKKPL
jgi:hypothetical protein